MKVNIKLIPLLLFILCTNHLLIAQESIVGKWKTIDDETGKARSVVEIYQKGELYYGRVIEMMLSPDEDPDPICNECEKDDPRYNQKVKGMEILKKAKMDGDEYTGGKILDPENGKVYSCKLWIEDGDLRLRGYIAFFYRTQTWKRME